jgi:hypothetical protein
MSPSGTKERLASDKALIPRSRRGKRWKNMKDTYAEKTVAKSSAQVVPELIHVKGEDDEDALWGKLGSYQYCIGYSSDSACPSLGGMKRFRANFAQKDPLCKRRYRTYYIIRSIEKSNSAMLLTCSVLLRCRKQGIIHSVARYGFHYRQKH